MWAVSFIHGDPLQGLRDCRDKEKAFSNCDRSEDWFEGLLDLLVDGSWEEYFHNASQVGIDHTDRWRGKEREGWLD